jgi:hypothetical protein
MVSPLDPHAFKGADDVEFTDAEIEALSKVHSTASWPLLKNVIQRYQQRAYDAIVTIGSSIEEIREAQGRIDMARQLIEFLEEQAPTKYKRMQEQDANDAESSRD